MRKQPYFEVTLHTRIFYNKFCHFQNEYRGLSSKAWEVWYTSTQSVKITVVAAVKLPASLWSEVELSATRVTEKRERQICSYTDSLWVCLLVSGVKTWHRSRQDGVCSDLCTIATDRCAGCVSGRGCGQTEKRIIRAERTEERHQCTG